MADEPTTLLVISGIDIPPYSVRGASQTLEPIEAAASLRRTLNGDLLDLAETQFRKYKSTITCSDQQSPALDGIWPGDLVTVDCVAELSYKTSGGSAERTVAGTRTDGDFTLYRPRLLMRVTGHTQQRDEWGAVTSWTLNLEEA